MSFLDRLFNRPEPRMEMTPLYEAIVARGRQPHWYAHGDVPDTLDGRFDMIAAILCTVLLRLEGDDATRQQSVWLTELFVSDMDGQLRQIGIGDMIVGKHIGKMMSALGGRLTAYRAGLAQGDLKGALVRNLYRGHAPSSHALAQVEEEMLRLSAALAATNTAVLLSGKLPQ